MWRRVSSLKVVFALVSDDSTTVRLHPKDHTSLKCRTWLEQALALRLAIQNHHPVSQ